MMFPYQKFFKPKPDFVKYMIQYHGEDYVYDIGAGVGHVSKILAEQKIRMHPIDNILREKYDFMVHIDDATNYHYRPKSVIMFARPCHGFFVQDTIDQAILKKAKTILYVGLNKNVESDLGDYMHKFYQHAYDVGKDKENIWRYDV